MMSETLQNEVVVLSKDQIAALDADVGKNYTFLESCIPAQQLSLLNPIILELQKFESFKNLKYDCSTQETKEKSIEDYKSYKAQLRSFGPKVGEVKKAIKGPLDDAGKKIVEIEKTLVKIKDDVVKALETEFEAYEKEKEEKAQELAEKKDAAKNQAILELSQQNSQILNVALKSDLINKLKFGSTELIGNRVQNAIENFTLEKIKELISELQETNFQKVVEGLNISILTEEEINDCQSRFHSQIAFFLNSLNARAQALSLTTEKVINQAAVEIVQKGVQAINAYDPNFIGEKPALIVPQQINTTPVAFPTPVPVNVPIEVQPGTLNIQTIQEYKTKLLEMHQQHYNTLVQMYNSYGKNINANSTDEEKSVLKSIHGGMLMAQKALEWITEKTK